VPHFRILRNSLRSLKFKFVILMETGLRNSNFNRRLASDPFSRTAIIRERHNDDGNQRTNLSQDRSHFCVSKLSLRSLVSTRLDNTIATVTMMDNQRPALVSTPTVQEDDDDSQEFFNPQQQPQTANRRAIAYLLRYETMVRQQEAEHLATVAHLKPLLQSLSSNDSLLTKNEEDVNLEQEITFQELSQALDNLENSPDAYMQTDRQLVMVLKTLTNKCAAVDDDASLTWAEFVQCYKTVIAGMQTLQHVQHYRNRVKDRTLSLLSLFEPPATKLLDEEGMPSHVPEAALERHDVRVPQPAVRLVRRKKLLYAVAGGLVGLVLGMATTLLLPPPAPKARVLETQVMATVLPSKTISASIPTKTPVIAPAIIPVMAPARAVVVPNKPTQSPATTQTTPPAATTPPASTTVVNKTLTPPWQPALVGSVVGMAAAPLVWRLLQALASPPQWTLVAMATVVVQGVVQLTSRLVRTAQQQ
jgi:hypothetical protein